MPTRTWRTFSRLVGLIIAVTTSPILGKADLPVRQSSQEPVCTLLYDAQRAYYWDERGHLKGPPLDVLSEKVQ